MKEDDTQIIKIVKDNRKDMYFAYIKGIDRLEHCYLIHIKELKTPHDIVLMMSEVMLFSLDELIKEEKTQPSK